MHVLKQLASLQTELEKAALSKLSEKEIDSISGIVLDLHGIFQKEKTLSEVSDVVFGEKFGEKIKEKGKTLDQAALAYSKDKPDSLNKIIGVMRSPAEFMTLSSLVLRAIDTLSQTHYEI